MSIQGTVRNRINWIYLENSHRGTIRTSLGFTIFRPRASLPRYIYVLLLFSRDWSLDYIECMVCNW